MGRFGRPMGGQAMIERIRPHGMEHRCSGGRHITIEQHRNALKPCRQNGARHGRQLAPAQPAQHFERIAEMVAVQCDGTAHRIRLALHALAVHAGAGADPVLRSAAIEPVADRCGDRGVANAHFADAEEFRTLDRLHAIGHGGRAVGLIQRRILGDVAGRDFERQFEDLESEAESLADLVHRRAIALEFSTICRVTSGG